MKNVLQREYCEAKNNSRKIYKNCWSKKLALENKECPIVYISDLIPKSSLRGPIGMQKSIKFYRALYEIFQLSPYYLIFLSDLCLYISTLIEFPTIGSV